MKLSFEDVQDVVTFGGSRFDPNKTTVFSIMRDEIYFCPAFFDHYRKIGYEQFLIFDDQSVDGTREFLKSQPDCVVVQSNLRYGDEIRVVRPTGKSVKRRAGIYFKGALTRLVAQGSYITYVDADEFLILPSDVTSIQAVISKLHSIDAKGMVAPMVEFFPRSFADLKAYTEVSSFSDLVKKCPWFEAERLLSLDGVSAKPIFDAQSKTTKLFERYNIEDERSNESKVRWYKRLFGKRVSKINVDRQQSARHKTAIMKVDPDVFMVGTHNLNVPPTKEVMLTLAHFVFTPNFPEKVERALEWKSHANGARKYKKYASLLEKMKAHDEAFLTEASIQFSGAQDFIDSGLMVWPEDP